MAGVEDELATPRDELVRRRWIPEHKVEWVKRANAIMVEHGQVRSQTVYDTQHKARWRARYLVDLMVDLGMHERWELRWHVERKGGGFVWAVEFLGRSSR